MVKVKNIYIQIKLLFIVNYEIVTQAKMSIF